jgi:hypothetical protein
VLSINDVFRNDIASDKCGLCDESAYIANITLQKQYFINKKCLRIFAGTKKLIKKNGVLKNEKNSNCRQLEDEYDTCTD